MEHHAGETFFFPRGAGRDIYHLHPFGILESRLVLKLEDSHGWGVPLARQRYSFGVRDDSVEHGLSSAN